MLSMQYRIWYVVTMKQMRIRFIVTMTMITLSAKMCLAQDSCGCSAQASKS